jgi:hypothetical protein
MPKLRRRAFAGTALAAPFAFNIMRSKAYAADYVFKFGNNVPETYPLNVRTRAAADRIRAATNGQFDLQIFPAGQLGTDTDMLSQVRSGAIDFYTASGLVLSTLVPLTAINALGFAFKDYSQVWPAMDGKLGAIIRAKIDTAGLHAIDKIFDIGFREVSSSTHPITDPDSSKPAWRVDVQGFGRISGDAELRRSLYGAANPCRGRPGEPTVHRRYGEVLRGAEIRVDDEPYVGRLLDAVQRAVLEEPAG